MTRALLLFIIIGHEVMHIEGRHLKSRRSTHEKSTSTSLSINGEANQGTAMHQAETSKVEHIDDFRPTSPGHSPGVGHSINN
ncbi:hypothetical protein FNV43_RR17207 [Rhamnella rubrinervis]|uniref:Encoded peptide n=1 Tax=Rhamnella rubrinervis TaxID=2594499 RepID=A0A8K0DWN5_9ROSA|nr:hypothetical protein FNV43_RR17207 [Rhamnella rubrinervis]